MTKPIIFIAGGIAALGIVSYFVYKHYKEKNENKFELKIDEGGVEIEY